MKKIIGSVKDINRIYIFKKKTLIAILVVGALIMSISIYYALSGLNMKKNSCKEYDRLFDRLNTVVDFGKSIPTIDALRTLESDKVVLKKQFKELEKSLSKGKPPTVSDPMEFKGKLLKLRRYYLDKSIKTGVKIPDGIGFGEFIGKKIPAYKEIPVLSDQLDKISILLNIVMINGVREILSVSRHGVSPQKVTPKDTSYFYNEYKFEVEFESDQQALVDILSALMTAKEFFVVRNINVKYVSESKYVIKLVISGLVFL
ncbi:MAG: Amuc_1100 family pilus-like protein [Candidatus Ancaeobacter aquaticus]|nr:Amuc_1100 family pilus-like protein [Candidatus Ancaeobacter aquaticus]